MKRKICSFLLAFLLLLALTPAALADGAQLSYITDDAGILTASETASLEKAAQHIAQRYGVGIYLVTVNDACRIDSRGTYEAAYTYYHRNSLGAGAERNGAILLLSMNDRAFAHFYYGKKSEYAFNSYAKEQIEDTFLDNFRENDWYGGFSDYLSACGEYLALAAEGHPVRRSPVPAIVISCAAGVLIAFLVCSILKRKMKSVYVQARADGYVSGKLRLARQTDRFTHRTETRRRIEPPKPSGGGGGSVGRTGGGGCRRGICSLGGARRSSPLSGKRSTRPLFP